MHFKKVQMSCIWSSLSSQVKFYIPVVTSGNANAANEALIIWRVCAALRKYLHLVGGCATGYIGILWNILGIPLSGEMMFLEKQSVFLDSYRLTLGKASSCKTKTLL